MAEFTMISNFPTREKWRRRKPNSIIGKPAIQVVSLKKKFNLALTFETKTTVQLFSTQFSYIGLLNLIIVYLLTVSLLFAMIYQTIFKMLGLFVTRLGTRLNIISPVRRMVFLQSGRPKILPEWHYQTARIGMQQQKLQFVIAMNWVHSQPMSPHVARIIVFAIVATKWKEKQKELLKKLRTGLD